MDYSPEITIESKVLPGVRFILHRMTVPRRARLHQEIAGIRERVREIQRERKPLDDEYRAAAEKARAAAKLAVDKLVAEGLTREEAEQQAPVHLDFPEDKLAAWSDSLMVQKRMEEDGVGIATLRALLVGIEGFTIAGEVPGVDRLIEKGPDELVDEMARAADKVAALAPGDRGNSLWPGTSEPAEAGPIASTIAPPAEPVPVSV